MHICFSIAAVQGDTEVVTDQFCMGQGEAVVVIPAVCLLVCYRMIDMAAVLSVLLDIIMGEFRIFFHHYFGYAIHKYHGFVLQVQGRFYYLYFRLRMHYPQMPGLDKHRCIRGVHMYNMQWLVQDGFSSCLQEKAIRKKGGV